ncbi:MAG: RDD family protein [Deltaproteobacteria bacterium]|nr:RDD family protein [Deltaproteobacteria bacterium]
MRRVNAQEIQFKPINNGLGFHPFSEGLPYTPAQKTFPKPPPRFVLPVVTKKPPQPITQPIQTQKVDLKIYPFGFFYLIKRVFAYILDSTINILISTMVISYILLRHGFDLNVLTTTPTILILFLFFIALLNWTFITVQEVALGTSLGKHFFGLKLAGKPGQIFLRAFFFNLSFWFCGLGLLWAIFKKDKKCWHDVATMLQPLEK